MPKGYLCFWKSPPKSSSQSAFQGWVLLGGFCRCLSRAWQATLWLYVDIWYEDGFQKIHKMWYLAVPLRSSWIFCIGALLCFVPLKFSKQVLCKAWVRVWVPVNFVCLRHHCTAENIIEFCKVFSIPRLKAIISSPWGSTDGFCSTFGYILIYRQFYSLLFCTVCNSFLDLQIMPAFKCSTGILPFCFTFLCSFL